MKGTRRIIWIVIGLVVLILGVGGYFITQGRASQLREGLTNLQKSTSFHVETNIKSGGQEISQSGDYVLPDKSYFTETLSGAVETSMTVLQVGTDEYSSADNGQSWTKSKDSSIATSFSTTAKIWEQYKPESVDSDKNAWKDADPANESIDGVDSRHVTGKTTDGATIDFWISNGDMPIIRQYKIALQDSTAFSVKYSKFNENTRIEAPVVP